MVFSLVVGNVNNSLVVVCTLLIAVTSLVAEVMWASVLAALWLSSCGFLALGHRLSSFGAWAKLLCCMWDLPRSGTEPVSPALAGGFFTTEPPGKPIAV